MCYSTGAAAAASASSMDAVSRNSRFFDHLVELVPAKHYLEPDSEQVNVKYLKKSARDEAKAAFKQQHKENKRAKLDPDRPRTTLELQREAAQRAEASGSDEDDDDEDASGGGSDDDSDGEDAGAQPGPQPGRAAPGAAGAQLAFSKGEEQGGRGAELGAWGLRGEAGRGERRVGG